MEVVKEYEIAQKRIRIVAFFLDYLIFSFILIILFAFFKTFIAVALLFILPFFYWPISEALSGQTLGKRILSIEVVSINLSPISLSQAIMRFFFAIIDLQMVVGLFVASTGKLNQRIGDRVANTIVIRKISARYH